MLWAYDINVERFDIYTNAVNIASDFIEILIEWQTYLNNKNGSLTVIVSLDKYHASEGEKHNINEEKVSNNIKLLKNHFNIALTKYTNYFLFDLGKAENINSVLKFKPEDFCIALLKDDENDCLRVGPQISLNYNGSLGDAYLQFKKMDEKSEGDVKNQSLEEILKTFPYYDCKILSHYNRACSHLQNCMSLSPRTVIKYYTKKCISKVARMVSVPKEETK